LTGVANRPLHEKKKEEFGEVSTKYRASVNCQNHLSHVDAELVHTDPPFLPNFFPTAELIRV